MHRLYIVIAILFLLLGFPRVNAQTGPADTLTGQVVRWQQLTATSSHRGTSRMVLNGATHDLAQLEIKALTLDTGVIVAAYGSEADELIIVRDGELDVSADSDQRMLGPGGVALFAAGARYSLENGGSTPVTYYLFHFRGRGSRDQGRAGAPFLIDWQEMVMKKTDKGESRPIFSRPVTWLGKLDMHATTLNPGEVSHAPHTHRAEEIILMRSGNVEEYISGKYYKASAGDLIFLPSGSLHAVENRGTGTCQYFALQWLP
ncbi:MAG TPA: cupin domain-containing protein [Puia sp.]|jgi:(S)-ureidoglycine aminohydrolase|nr:cupin domain-containing protein [Puia sp.]